jgi:outer membrane protein TolC
VAQDRRLTLAEAIELATARSASLDIARAGESRADADLQRAKSLRLPQLSFAGSYDRTLASEFSSAFESIGPPCAPLTVDPNQALADRIAEIERAAQCGGLGAAFNFSELPFGQRNIYRATLSFSQALYAGGRIDAQQTQAEAGRRVAELATTAAEAQVALQVTQAYFDAALADRLVAIAEAGERQAQAVFDQARLSVDAGRAPEFEMLRAQVARDNQRPIVIRRRADRDLAYLRLRQLLELPASETFVLDVNLDAETLPPPAPFADSLAAAQSGETVLTDRIGGRQAQAVVSIREAGVTMAQADRKPSINLLSSFGQVGYPTDGAFPGASDFRTNWTLGAAVSWPVFTGFRLRANELAARADLAEAQAQLEQTREAAQLEAASVTQDVASAIAVWEASASVIQQAQRAYEIAELRYREGISTQLELQDSRLALQQAQANRAQAARDVQVARARLALLPSLPFGVR